METIPGIKILQQIAADNVIHPMQVSLLNKLLLDGADNFLSNGRKDKQRGDQQGS